MNASPGMRQLTGRDSSTLVAVAPGQRLQQEAASAFVLLQADAREAGFELAVASAYRSFERQLLIWNGKAGGSRPVTAADGGVVAMAALSAAQQLQAIMRFSAIPGTSRHHWGSDLDVYDAAVMPRDYQLQLSPAEVAAGGLFAPLHEWLDRRMARCESHGFYRPYNEDRGGVAPERWHLSYAPQARQWEGLLNESVLQQCWDSSPQPLLLRQEIERNLPRLLDRYVAVPARWCPAP